MTPEVAASVEALKRWRGAYPIVAMRTLAAAGYDRDARAAWLRKVARVQPDAVAEYASDAYVSLLH